SWSELARPFEGPSCGSTGARVPDSNTIIKYINKTACRRSFCQNRRLPASFPVKTGGSKGKDWSGKEEEAAAVRLGPVSSTGVECGGGCGGEKVTG
ncbi:unnamed protein product, partial [Prunus brigantina]